MRNSIGKIILSLCLCAMFIIGNAQTVIQMEEYGGVYRIPCKVNGAKMKLIFDTGAEKVCLSLSMANYLYDNDYITDEDIVGSGTSTVADGSIVDHIKIIIKDIEIEGFHLRNVEAVVIDGQNAPLLLGQSAIKKLGKYSISGNKLIISTGSSPHPLTQLTKEEFYNLISEAGQAYEEGAYYVALEKYKILFDYDLLNALGKKEYADCYYYTDQEEDALEIYQSIQMEIEKDFPEHKVDLYFQIGRCLSNLKKYDAVFPWMEKVKQLAKPWGDYQADAVWYMAVCSYDKGNYYRSQRIYDDYIKSYLSYKKYRPLDCWRLNSRDQFLSKLYYIRYMLSTTDDDLEKYLMISARWGNEEAIITCNKLNYKFWIEPSQYSYPY